MRISAAVQPASIHRYLASDASSGFVTGQVLKVNGGIITS